MGVRDRIRRRFTHRILESDGRSCAVFGEIDWFRPHVKRLCLGWRQGRPCQERTGWHGGDVVSTMWRLAKQHGVAVGIGLPLSPAQTREVFLSPRMVGLSRPLTNDAVILPVTSSNSLRSDIRLIRRSGYTWSCDPDLTRLQTFLDQHHLPTVKARYGAEGHTLTHDAVGPIMVSRTHMLIRIFKGGEWVAGLLAEFTHGALHMRQLGWLNGSIEELHGGVVGAIYLAALEKAFDLNASRLVFGLADPLLENGLFVYKAKWGGELDAGATSSHALLWAFDPAHPNGRRFFQEKTLIGWNNSRRFVILAAEPRLGNSRYRSNLRGGFEEWYHLRDHPKRATEPMDPDLPRRLSSWFARERDVRG